MQKFIRICIAVLVLLAIIFVAKSKVVWAAKPAPQGNQPAVVEGSQIVSPASHDECDGHYPWDQDKCKDKDKDKDKCKDKHHHCGTVQPPDDDVDICDRGGYSVGGVATVDVRNLKDHKRKTDCFNAHLESSENLPGLPQNAGPALSDLLVLTSVGQGSNITICFAAPPGHDVAIYYSGRGSWRPVGTHVSNGLACAHVPGSGSYVLAGR